MASRWRSTHTTAHDADRWRRRTCSLCCAWTTDVEVDEVDRGRLNLRTQEDLTHSGETFGRIGCKEAKRPRTVSTSKIEVVQELLNRESGGLGTVDQLHARTCDV